MRVCADLKIPSTTILKTLLKGQSFINKKNQDEHFKKIARITSNSRQNGLRRIAEGAPSGLLAAGAAFVGFMITAFPGIDFIRRAQWTPRS
jgi:hypothetical protein